MTNKRPKPLRLPTEEEQKIATCGLIAATLGNSLNRLLEGRATGYVLIIMDEEGAALATSEEPDEAINVLTHFARNASLLKEGYLIRDCNCSQCESFRRSERPH